MPDQQNGRSAMHTCHPLIFATQNKLLHVPLAAAVLDAKTLPDIFAGKRGPEKKEGALRCLAGTTQQQHASI
jgi:hypothetical protein